MDFYERLEKLRKKEGISQGDLEKELGFSNGSISKWKRSTPTPDRLQRLATHYNVSVDYLITGVEPNILIETAKTDVELSLMEDNIKNYALKLSNLPKDKQEQIMSLIDMLEDK